MNCRRASIVLKDLLFIFGRHFTFQIGAGGGFTDYGDRLAWSPRLKLGLGAAF